MDGTGIKEIKSKLVCKFCRNQNCNKPNYLSKEVQSNLVKKDPMMSIKKNKDQTEKIQS